MKIKSMHLGSNEYFNIASSIPFIWVIRVVSLIHASESVEFEMNGSRKLHEQFRSIAFN